MKNFKDLNIWKRGMNLVEEVYKLTKTFPKEEIYGLTAQIRRAAVSIPSNIAEGFGRGHNKEYKQFLYFAIGSCAELSTQFIIAGKLEYIVDTGHLLSEIDEISKMIMGLIKKLR
ncbi:MAG: four helix bundle protein [Candidatus Omnitrophota bacterium]|nr:four helix bundle protein [Candidatus Omnitrophota bacterium]